MSGHPLFNAADSADALPSAPDRADRAPHHKIPILLFPEGTLSLGQSNG
jgi:hypothetical protein